MLTFRRSTGVAAAALAIFSLGGVPQASAKMTYEQAFAKCKAEISANVSPNESRDTAARYAAGGACMKKQGFRLKKGAKM